MYTCTLHPQTHHTHGMCVRVALVVWTRTLGRVGVLQHARQLCKHVGSVHTIHKYNQLSSAVRPFGVRACVPKMMLLSSVLYNLIHIYIHIYIYKYIYIYTYIFNK